MFVKAPGANCNFKKLLPVCIFAIWTDLLALHNPKKNFHCVKFVENAILSQQAGNIFLMVTDLWGLIYSRLGLF